MPKCRILSLDGGGLRGIITARLLHRLNTENSIAGWLDDATLIAGTSTGGILGLGLAAKMTPDEIMNIYLKHGKKIFDDSVWDNIRDIGKIVGADYSNKNLKLVLKDIFQEMTLKDLIKKVAIPTFDLDNESNIKPNRTWKPKIFHNYKGSDSDGDFLVRNVALYTSSAPTYFPSADGYIDGGVYANNPSIVALSQAISRDNDPSERASLDEVVLLSVGTGVSLKYIKGATLDWGLSQWVKPLIDVLMDGVAGVSDYQARQFLGDAYRREQVIFGPNEVIELDAVKKMDRMVSIADKHDIAATVAWIKQYW